MERKSWDNKFGMISLVLAIINIGLQFSASTIDNMFGQNMENFYVYRSVVVLVWAGLTFILGIVGWFQPKGKYMSLLGMLASLAAILWAAFGFWLAWEISKQMLIDPKVIYPKN